MAGVSSVFNTGGSEIAGLEFTTDNCVGIDELSLDKLFKIYPNPAQNRFYIATNLIIDKVKIYNSLGILVSVSENADNSIDVSQLKDGIYIVQIISDNRIGTKRISITR